ncbi:tRNA (adenine(22)-N(1))-methyltransferase TrmK [Cellvibrio sp. pealriver]|uniref:tRNA (adenine(22)-N(1))-methyltransferase n=1 Tax=Cellvibrio sp. pealriver TaxID=1622269 RepID=UPI00069F9FE1|nr:tRNA (adenine(22)-N(1))-methyltransferase TrmK [Cellvibrio sp. pealriver]
MKLSKRLQKIESMVSSQYDHIWDCCCDHGLLGAKLVTRKAAPYVHFVDLVPELMDQLENKLKRYFPIGEEPNFHSLSYSQWQVHCMDLCQLQLQEFKGKHLVIIAGVGGDLMSTMVKAIAQNNAAADIDFLLCPVHHQYTLRQQLIALDLGLKAETLMIENRRYYEIILASPHNNNGVSTISPVGDSIWQCRNQEEFNLASGYLNKTLAHYQRQQLKRGAEVQPIIDAYSAVTLQYS